MISELLKQVMREFDLKQADLVDLLGVSLSRVKSMTSGRVKNLKREESEALIGKLGIRAEWLVTGIGPMLEDHESQDQFIDRMQAIKQVTALVRSMPFREFSRARLAALATGDPAQDGPLIAQALTSESQGIDFVTGERYEPAPAHPSGEEKLLLDYYRDAPAAMRKAAMAVLLSAGNAPAGQLYQGDGGVQIGSVAGSRVRVGKK